MNLALIVTAQNSSPSLPSWFKDLEAFRKKSGFPETVLGINNASSDATGSLMHSFSASHAWFSVLHLTEPQKRGLAVLKGVEALRDKATHVAWMSPEDGAGFDDLEKIWIRATANPKSIHKGFREWKRNQSITSLVASATFSAIARTFTHLPVRDFGGLPMITPMSLLQTMGPPEQLDLLFETAVLSRAFGRGIEICEHPVAFVPRSSRAAGVDLGEWIQKVRGLFRIRRIEA